MTDPLFPPPDYGVWSEQPLDQLRFHPPLSSHGGIARALLINRMEQRDGARIVLLLAPAGYGKTTLMVQWMERILFENGHAIWLTLDAGDNDPAQLIRNLHGALRESVEAGADDAIALMERLGPHAPQHTVFLDECEKLVAEPALHVARTLLNRLPHNVRLVISSRDKPALGLERHRVRGELLELTASDLSFDADETQRFFSDRTGARLSIGLLDRLQAITGGWPAALQLTALAARTEQDLERYASDLSGSLAHIAGYLAEDVLQAQTPEVRAFLLETCDFPRLSNAVCNAATGRTDSNRILQYLERHGLFTTPLDLSHTWYRYHPLFSQFLQSQKSLVLAPEQISATRRGAARWFARQGAAVEAVDLWLLAGDTDAAIRQMGACAHELLMQAQFGTVLRWVERLGEESLSAAGPELLLATAWACCFQGDQESAMRWLERLMPSLEASREHKRLYDELLALEPILIAMRGDTGVALERGLAHWQVIGEGHHFATGALANVIAYCLMLDGEFERARRFCADARARNEEIGSALGLGYAISVAGMIEAMQGNFQQALEQFTEVDEIAMRTLRQPWFETAYVKVSSVGLIVSVLYETDRLDEADKLLQRYFPLVMNQPSLHMRILTHVMYARLKIALGDVDGALDILLAADQQLGGSPQAARGRHIIDWERVRIELIGGRKERALARAGVLERALGNRHSGHSFVEELCGDGIEAARLDIARGQAQAALARLDAGIAIAHAAGRRWRLLKLLLLRTLALDALDQAGLARACLVHALMLGWQIGARRSFSDEDPRLAVLLARMPAAALAELGGGSAVIAYWRSLCGEALQEQNVPAVPAAVDLSERERAILALLATGMGNERLAASLFLSVNTVKWHIRRILEKLKARNRNEAVFLARQLGLVPES